MSDADIHQLAARLRALEDREAIRDVIAAYGPAVDRGDSAGAAALWNEGGSYDVGGYGTCEGQAAITALMDGPTHRDLIAGGAAHVLSAPKISVVGDNAVAVNYSCVFRHTGAAFEVYRVAANRWTLSRDGDGGWRVDQRVNRLLDGDEAARLLLG